MERTGGTVMTRFLAFEAAGVRALVPANGRTEANAWVWMSLRAIVLVGVRARSRVPVRANLVAAVVAVVIAEEPVTPPAVVAGRGAWVADQVPSDSVSTRPCSAPVASV